MDDVSCWSSLSAEERAACTGELRPSLCCSQHAWQVVGSLQSDWTNRVRPQIDLLIRRNYKRVFGKEGAHAPLALHLFLLSPTKDSAAAIPTVFVLCADKKAASRARKLLLKHEVFKGLGTGFDVKCEPRSIFMRAGNAEIVSDHEWISQSSSMCGVPVVVAPSPGQVDSAWRHATIFCTIRLGHRHYAVIPAHVFCPEVQTVDTVHDADSGVDVTSDASSLASTSRSSSSLGLHDRRSVNDDQLNDCSVSTSSARDTDETWQSDAFATKRVVYINFNRTAPHNSQEHLALLGQFDPAQKLAELRTANTFCHHLDYALVAIDDPRFERDSSIDISGTESQILQRVVPAASAGMVVLASASASHIIVKMSSATMSIVMPWSKQPIEVWEVEHTLAEGDSGSTVFNQDGWLVGMAVATVPELNTTYVVPAKSILLSIKTQMGRQSSVSMPMTSAKMESDFDHLTNDIKVIDAANHTRVRSRETSMGFDESDMVEEERQRSLLKWLSHQDHTTNVASSSARRNVSRQPSYHESEFQLSGRLSASGLDLSRPSQRELTGSAKPPSCPKVPAPMSLSSPGIVNDESIEVHTEVDLLRDQCLSSLRLGEPSPTIQITDEDVSLQQSRSKSDADYMLPGFYSTPLSHTVARYDESEDSISTSSTVVRDRTRDFLCPFLTLDCNKAFSNVVEFKIHVFSHFRGQPLPAFAPCPLCSQLFLQSNEDDHALAWNNMLSHMVAEHYLTHQETYTFNTNAALMRYMWNRRIISDYRFRQSQLGPVNVFKENSTLHSLSNSRRSSISSIGTITADTPQRSDLQSGEVEVDSTDVSHRGWHMGGPGSIRRLARTEPFMNNERTLRPSRLSHTERVSINDSRPTSRDASVCTVTSSASRRRREIIIHQEQTNIPPPSTRYLRGNKWC